MIVDNSYSIQSKILAEQKLSALPHTNNERIDSQTCTEPMVMGMVKLQALVYDIIPSTTAVFSYAIGSRKLSANEQFFCWCSNSSKFVTNNSDKTRRVIYSRQQSLHQHK